MTCTECTLERAVCETGLDIVFNIGLRLPDDDTDVLLMFAAMLPDFVEKYAPNPAREKRHHEELTEAIDVYLAHVGLHNTSVSKKKLTHLLRIARMWVTEEAIPDEVFTSFGKLKVVKGR